MKEILENYYDIYIEHYKKQNNGITFFIDGREYYLYQTKHKKEYIEYIYKISSNYKKLHEFIFNKHNQLLSDNYILFRLQTFNTTITYQDIKEYAIPIITNNYIPMEQFWEEKLDYLEEQTNQLSNNIKLKGSFAYFEGISEAILSLLRNNQYQGNLVLSHKIFSLSTIEFYNPLNITYDLPLRDIASYIRKTKEKDKLYSILEQNLSPYVKNYLFARLTFPFSYFEELQDILIDKKDKTNLNNYIKHIKEYENYLKFIQNTFNIKIFSWINN